MGATISGLPDMLAEHDDDMIRAWLDAYHAAGGPELDYEEVLYRYRLGTCVSALGIYSNNVMTAANKANSKTYFKGFPAWNCDAVRNEFGLRFGFGMNYGRIMLFVLKGDKYWAAFDKFLNERA